MQKNAALRKNAELTRKQWKSVHSGLELLRLTAVQWWNDDTFRYAAALAFYTLFSLAPVVLAAVGIASLFYIPEIAIENIMTHVRRLAGAEAARAVGQVIEASGSMGRSAWAVIVGTVTFILGASVVFGELQAALNRIWDVKTDPCKGIVLPLVLDRLRSFGIALTVGFLMVVSLVANSTIDGMQLYAERLLPGVVWLWQAANATVSFAVVVVLFAMIYKYLPDVRLVWRDVWMGAVVTAALFIAGKYAIGFYLGQTAIAGTFGAAGSLAVLLVWVYYSALISFFGAEFTQVYAKHRGKTIKPGSHMVRAGKKPVQ